MSGENRFELTPENIARRYGVRPGFRLVTAVEVGLPVYSLRLRTVVMEQKPVPPISEFVLRSIAAGVGEEAVIQGLLGLEGPIVRETLVTLRCAEEIDLLLAPAAPEPTWKLTQKGQRTMQVAGQVRPEEVSISVYFDGLLRRPVAVDDDILRAPSALRASGLTEIRPIPARPPHLDEVPLKDVNEVIKRMLRRRQRRRDLLVVKAILNSRILFRPAIMLVYRSANGNDVQVAFAIDGMLSTEHEAAFAAADGARRLLITQGAKERSVQEIAQELLPAEVLNQLGNLDAVEKVQDRILAAEAEVGKADTALTRANTDHDREAARLQVDTAKRKLAESEIALGTLPVRLVPMLEHRRILNSAVDESKVRLMIDSPWMNSSVVTLDFLKRLEQRLTGGLKVYIAYGLGPEKDKKRQTRSEAEAENALRNLARTYSNLRLTRLGDTHAKILVSDSKYAVVTSFNWLSFRGDPHRTFRDERGVMILIPSVVEAQFGMILRRMDEVDAQRNRAGVAAGNRAP